MGVYAKAVIGFTAKQFILLYLVSTVHIALSSLLVLVLVGLIVHVRVPYRSGAK
ncbi:hypothetical protein [Paenibacillus ehimensis]|uniref:hypothetical protein n=1 Tax=Paenibacillus ehimensis TaxID=79264 RepID=UPI000B065619|nr:hypothetical protein [Paenibacillus ehimensis]MEC0213300.1 hypothetical protein [Paenibacillus ehimensis]